MLKDPLARDLYAQFCEMPTVDAHEHLHPEERRVGRKVDIFLLFDQYLHTQLVSAGMDPQKASTLGSEEVPEEEKWEAVAPYLDRVRDCGCAGPPFEALRRFFGEEDLTAGNYAALSEKMRAHNSPGLFDRCLRETCGIALVLNQNRTMWQNDLFRPILPEDHFIGAHTREAIESVAREMGASAPRSLSACVSLMEEFLARRVAEGMIGVKGTAYAYEPGDPDAAALAYGRVVDGKARGGDGVLVATYLRDVLYERCGEQGIVVAKHSGVWAGGWADATNIRPTNIMPVAARHRNTRFDLFHAGTPFPADAGFIARGFPNVWLNLCWSHLLSPRQATEALDLWLDMAPINRFFAFGGDYWWAVENVYGALAQAREVVARVLARRIREEGMTESRALMIARRWFHDNPREVYGV
ncbi:MAG: amidohydrolase family protein [Armatimonadetes bacterium]|nr:amidohydrolase family protein [Armatimonadota bacterium]